MKTTSIQKYVFGKPIDTKAVIKDVDISENLPNYIGISDDKQTIAISLGESDKVYGLGEAVRGINKRGWIYETYCNDDPVHTETKRSLYGAHPFVMIAGNHTFGLFVDFPDRVTFDVGYTDINKLQITVKEANYSLYVIESDSPRSIVKHFRQLIGKSYIAPFWAFGFQQSRWSYANADAVRSVIDNYRSNGFPIDAVYLDIDYMEDFKDFTINEERFPNFKKFVEEAKEKNIHLVPIIDAGVKIEKGYKIYEEGKALSYFCKDEDGNDFIAAVWPGKVCFPDFLNNAAANWFGEKYKYLIDMGIDGFWNDMNEPAIFYSEKRLDKAIDTIAELKCRNIGIYDYFRLKDTVYGISNNPDDYKSIYHSIDGTQVCHDRVHNLFGTCMTKSAANAFKRIAPDKNILMFSRASYIGMHRYSGIWMGDNQSWWSHIKLNLQMLPSLNMCGFLYSGADIGGFGDNCTEDLLLRWLALGIFTPLMRNHSALGTRDQEFYRFSSHKEAFRSLLQLRYSLIPYIYSEFIKAAENNELLFTPLSFEYRGDKYAESIEDQLLVGENIMIAPVYEPNAVGRYVYIPEEMTAVHFKAYDDYTLHQYSKGHYYIEIPLNEVVVFIRKNKVLTLVSPADCTANLDMSTLHFIGDVAKGQTYTLYTEGKVENGETVVQKHVLSI